MPKRNKLVGLIEAGIRRNEYMGQAPTEKQAAAMCFKGRELLYGGAAGGGKSSLLLLGALQYVDVQGYSAGIFRRKFSDLTKPKGLIDRSHEFLGNTNAVWTGWNHRWTFPSGAMLSFWGLEHAKDVHDHSSSEYDFIGFEELADFLQMQYIYMFSRQRGASATNIPLRCWAVTNPPDEHQHDADWIMPYFIEAEPTEEKLYIPAFMEDNPYLNQEAYSQSLDYLGPVMKARMKRGDWFVREAGKMFQRQWFEIFEEAPANIERVVRTWDMAATKQKPGKPADWTVGLLMGRAGPLFIVLDVIRMQGDPGDTDKLMKQTALADRAIWGKRYAIREEQEGGSSGKTVIHRRTQEMAGFDYEGTAPRESKTMRARPLAVQAKAGNVKLLSGPWNKVWLDEHERFPGGSFDDQVDGGSLAFSHLTDSPEDATMLYYRQKFEKMQEEQRGKTRAKAN